MDCYPYGYTSGDNAPVAVSPTVHIPIVDVEQDYIETTLTSSGTGLFTLKWVGPGTSFTIVQQNRAAGTFTDSFRLSDLTSGSAFTSLQATWVVNGETGSDSKSYNFTVLGDYLNTCYNTPAESDYTGGSFTAGTATSSCVWSSRSFLTAFLDSVNLNGSGVDSSSTALQIEGFCGSAPGSSPAYNLRRYRRPTTIKTSCNNPPAVNVTVASPSLACGTSVYIKTIGVRTVQDTGGGLANDQLDNYMGIGRNTCNGWSNNRRRTIRFN
jgi:3D (Asp-Asp-Asp) domain-containing protein